MEMEGLFPTLRHNALVCCSASLSHLYTKRYNKITFVLLACRYRSLKPYLIADKFKDLIYVKQNLFLS